MKLYIWNCLPIHLEILQSHICYHEYMKYHQRLFSSKSFSSFLFSFNYFQNKTPDRANLPSCKCRKLLRNIKNNSSLTPNKKTFMPDYNYVLITTTDSRENSSELLLMYLQLSEQNRWHSICASEPSNA